MPTALALGIGGDSGSERRCQGQLPIRGGDTSTDRVWVRVDSYPDGSNPPSATLPAECTELFCCTKSLSFSIDNTINPTVNFGVLFGWTNMKTLASSHCHHIF
ncbi:uncharacterized protein [Triticum aestivum]|uniref:uncharacterized protein n=1 Tax=Triticum aestivum TaxID=4565 RepID=UPI001D02C5F8|nr:uncharacterized protein LOC123038905 [Triticum aestivum]